MQNEYDILMKECLRLAIKGFGKVFPNPMVGCLILKNNRIIGKGFHKFFGGAHAEVNAINDAKSNGFNLKDSTLIVNLEPCSHYGKTPPCTDLILRKKIKKVVIGTPDPNPLVNGKGIKLLRSKGIEVISGIMGNECIELNKRFYVNILQKRPYITLKVAQSIDGKIALENFESKWITNINARKFAHKLRAENDAILIGRNTAEKDNPMLNNRLYKSKKNPIRVIIDPNLKLKSDLQIFQTENLKTLIVHSQKSFKPINQNNLDYLYIKNNNREININQLAKLLYKYGINSILVEGGSFTLSQFFIQDIFDEIYVMIAPKILGKGISAFSEYHLDSIKNSKQLVLNKIIKSENDLIINYRK